MLVGSSHFSSGAGSSGGGGGASMGVGTLFSPNLGFGSTGWWWLVPPQLKIQGYNDRLVRDWELFRFAGLET